jgi:hypothetical protein
MLAGMQRPQMMLSNQPQMIQPVQPMQAENPWPQPNFTPTLAAGDGVSYQTHKAMREAGVGPYENMPAPAPVEVRSVGGSTPNWEIQLRDRQRREAAKKLGLPENSTDEQIRDATLKMRMKK